MRTNNVAGALGKIGESSQDLLQALAHAIRDKESAVRERALIALGELGKASPSVIREMVNALEDNEWLVRQQAARALGRLGPAARDAVPQLIRALRDPQGIVRQNAARALGSIGEPARDAVTALAQTVPDNQDSVRHYDSTALRDIEESARHVVPALIDALRDSQAGVRLEAAWALGRIGEPARPALSVLEEKPQDPETSVWQAMDSALMQIRGTAGPNSAGSVQGHMPAAQGLERMGESAAILRPKLKTFLFVGLLLRSRDRNSLDLQTLERLLKKEFNYSISGKTIGKHLEALEEFFVEYYAGFHNESAVEFIDRSRGRPPEILNDGWNAWQETKEYFERMGWSRERTDGPH